MSADRRLRRKEYSNARERLLRRRQFEEAAKGILALKERAARPHWQNVSPEKALLARYLKLRRELEL